MSGFVEHPHDECSECRHFNPNKLQPICKRCGAGEFFDERFDDREMKEFDLMNFYAGDNNDE